MAQSSVIRREAALCAVCMGEKMMPSCIVFLNITLDSFISNKKVIIFRLGKCILSAFVRICFAIVF